MKEQHSPPLIDVDQTQLVGINLKTFRTVIGWGLSSMITLIGCTVLIVSTLKDFQRNTDLQIRTLEVRVGTLETEVKLLRQRQDAMKPAS